MHEYNFDHPGKALSSPLDFLSYYFVFFFLLISKNDCSADAFDTEQLLHCAETLKSGQPYQVPIYDFKTHQRRSDSFRQVPTLLYSSMILDVLFLRAYLLSL